MLRWLAFFLISHPSIPLPAHLSPELHAAIRAEAEALEILDPREDFCLETIRDRFEWLQDAPRIADCERWPPAESIKVSMDANRAYRLYLDNARPITLGRSEWFDATLIETQSAWHVYELVGDAQCSHSLVSCRRAALLQLRDALGAEHYAAGLLPPPVPFWRFHTID